MKRHVPSMLAATALAVAVLGATPVGGAAGTLVAKIPPFAKKAGFATTAGDALRLGGHKPSTSGEAGAIPVLDAQGKLPASIGAVGPQGPKGDRGAAADTSKLLGKTLIVTASRVLPIATVRTDYVLCPAGSEAVGGGAWWDPADANTDKLQVVFSVPRVGGNPPADSTNGPAAGGWLTRVANTSTKAGPSPTVHWTAVCSKVGG
ncbi:MAG TPA: hypothetical protein VFA24_04900 [Gaiellaceae bacterium]|nr:hypothetical protein [Gaiellaceae bacterium]